MNDNAAARPPRLTLEQTAIAAAGLIAEARAAGLVMPYSVNVHDYGPTPHATLYIEEHQDRDIWRALAEWAGRYRTEVSARPSTTPGSIYATAEFSRDGVDYDISAIIRQPAGDDGQPGPQDAG
jgi:hypothetical protein